MIRGGHLDITMLGSFQVSETCDIANWMIPGKVMKGMGGAMDLVSSGSRVIVLMQHSAFTKKGEREIKFVPECTLPLTAKGVVSMVITELAVFENRSGKLVLTEIAEGFSLEDLQAQTGFKITCAEPLKTF
jgi:3-oxoacid CoA-transferase B subunit